MTNSGEENLFLLIHAPLLLEIKARQFGISQRLLLISPWKDSFASLQWAQISFEPVVPISLSVPILEQNWAYTKILFSANCKLSVGRKKNLSFCFSKPGHSPAELRSIKSSHKLYVWNLWIGDGKTCASRRRCNRRPTAAKDQQRRTTAAKAKMGAKTNSGEARYFRLP